MIDQIERQLDEAETALNVEHQQLKELLAQLESKLLRIRKSRIALTGNLGPQRTTQRGRSKQPSANKEVVEPIVRELASDNAPLPTIDLETLTSERLRHDSYSLSGFSRVFSAVVADLLVEVKPGIVELAANPSPAPNENDNE